MASPTDKISLRPQLVPHAPIKRCEFEIHDESWCSDAPSCAHDLRISPSTRHVSRPKSESDVEASATGSFHSTYQHIDRKEYDRMRKQTLTDSFFGYSAVDQEDEGTMESDNEGGYDTDLDEMFAGSRLGRVPHVASHFTEFGPRPFIVVHGLGVLLLVVRFAVLWLYVHACIAELLKCFTLIVAFIILGMFIPYWADSLFLSDPIRRIVHIRHAYEFHSYRRMMRQDDKWIHQGILKIRSYYSFARPFTLTLGALLPSMSLGQVLFTPLDKLGSFQTHNFSILICATGSLWFIFMAAFGLNGVELICLDASQRCVEGLASDIDLDWKDRPHEIDWASVHRRFVKVHEVMDSVWMINNVGGLRMLRVLILLSSTLATGAQSLLNPSFYMRLSYRFSAAFCALATCYLLSSLAWITLRCTDQRPNSKSLTELALRHGGRIVNAKAQVEYQGFLIYLLRPMIGIQILGIQITPRLVIVIFGQFVVSFQVAINSIAQVLYPGHFHK